MRGAISTVPRNGRRYRRTMALEMRDACERCGTPTGAGDLAFICSFECTWCSRCVDGFPGRACPNCGGDLQVRPTRAA